jgi:hypothetical protein
MHRHTRPASGLRCLAAAEGQTAGLLQLQGQLRVGPLPAAHGADVPADRGGGLTEAAAGPAGGQQLVEVLGSRRHVYTPSASGTGPPARSCQ